MDVCAIVVTYNRKELLEKCITRIENQEYKVKHLLVFNNNSDDGTNDLLKRVKMKYSNVIVYNSKSNLGGAGGFSEAVKRAYMETKDDYFWIMDDDTMPERESLRSFVSTSQNLKNNFGLLCSKVLWKDGSTVNAPIIDRRRWQNRIVYNVIGIERATFVSILIKRQVVEKIGIPAADMVIWGDDAEYTTRISHSYPAYLDLNSVAYHDTPLNTTNLNIFNDNVNRLERYFYGYRNAISIARMYSNSGKVIKIILKDNYEILKIIFSKSNNKFKRIRTILKGIIIGMTFKPKIKKI
ncbi:glycosyltransferase [Companilactobacillus alimentarius]|uniref:glycosyltransferase n=1 Tax=Companilactobacillus alimentarius TaxID=1602 RepID=UPI003D7C7D66